MKKHIGVSLCFCLLFVTVSLLVLVPKTTSAAAITVTTATTTSSNASTTLAKVGDTVQFGLNLSGTPWEAPKINIFGMGTTSFSGSGAWWNYSTTSASSWTAGAISFYVSYGGTLYSDATTTKSQADLTGSNVTFDKTAPTGYTVAMDSYVNRAASTTASFTFAGAEVGASYLYQLGDGTASTTGTGTIVTATDAITSINVSALTEGTLTLNVSLTDPAGNGGATTSDTAVLDVTVPLVPTASPSDSPTYYTTTAVTLASSGSDTILYTTNNSNPVCPSTGTTFTSISVASTQTIKAIGCDNAGNPSTVASFVYTIGSPSGGGGGSSHRKTTTPATTPSTVAPPAASPAAVASPLGAVATAAARDLFTGVSGEDVRSLQKFLNTHGFVLAPSGPGSLGQETAFFGGLTRAALSRLQTQYSITPTAGYLGPKTRALLRSLGY